MASQAIRVGRPLISRTIRPRTTRAAIQQIRSASQAGLDPDVADPNMSGGYINPPPRKRALRDPYGDWWDPQERRNFGEPVHEDNDTLGVFSTEPYTHSKPGKAALHLSFFVLAVLGLCGIVYQTYPDKPSAPREFPGGLESELGGPKAKIARKRAEEDLN